MFYKWDGMQLHEIPSVYAPGFTLLSDAHTEYEYPVAGWYWFDTANAAKIHFGLPLPEPDGKDLVTYATFKRWQKEIGGIVVNGVSVPTDDRAKLLILGAAQTMDIEDTAPLIINGVNHGIMTGAHFKALNSAVVAHVQATFPVLASILNDIANGNITTTAQIDEIFNA